jgi:hypothetical protein
MAIRTLNEICNDLIPYKNTNAGERDRILREKSKLVHENSKLLAEAEISQLEHDEEIRKMKIIENFSAKPKSEQIRKARNHYNQVLENAKIAILIESLTEIFFESVMLDDDFKLANRNLLVETGNNLLVEAFEKKLLTLDSFELSESSVMQNFYGIANKYAAEIAGAFRSEDVSSFLDSAVSEILAEAGDDIREIVREKVVEVVKTEQEIAQQNEEDLAKSVQEGFNFTKKTKPTLFKSIMIGVAKSPFSEDKSFLEKKDFKMILAESIIQYTFLEVLNTTNLVPISANEAQKMASSFRFM